MPKKGKKGPSQKRASSSGKPTKKQAEDVTETIVEDPATTEEQSPNTDPPESSQEQEATPADLHQPSGIIIQKCEQIEKLAASIQKKCKISANSKKPVCLEDPSRNAQELEFLLSEIKKLAQRVGCDVDPPPEPYTDSPEEPTEPIVFYDKYLLPYKWPKSKNKVPYIFLHGRFDLEYLLKEIRSRGIKFYQPKEGSQYTKLLCNTLKDHEKMVEYLVDLELPHHTFSNPSNKIMKVVIRGIPDDVDLAEVKEVINSASIPVVRLHDLNTNSDRKSKHKVILVVVPENAEGKKLLKVKSMFGRLVKVERPMPKVKQCHRCQKWGHAQRFCQGRTRCVKCAGDHFSRDCGRDPEIEPPKCANCHGDHTASYRRCPHCPDSEEYKDLKIRRHLKAMNISPDECYCSKIN